MGVFCFIALFVLIRRLSASFKFSPVRAKWMSQVTLGPWVTGGSYILAQIFFWDWLILFSGAAMLLAAILFAEREPDFKSFSSVLKAHFPLAGATMLAGITEFLSHKFYDKYESFFGFAMVGAFVWVFARW